MTRARGGSKYLRPNHGCYCPQQVVNIAVRTARLPHPHLKGRYLEKLGIGAACFWRFDGRRACRIEWASFNTPEAFWSWLITKHKPKRSLWLACHGLGRILTLLDFWQLIDEGFYRLCEEERGKDGDKETANAFYRKGDYLLCTKDPPTIIVAKHNQHTLHGVDLRNYWNCSMDGLAELAELPRAAELPAGAPLTMWEASLRRDVEIQRKVIVELFRWWQGNDMGVFRYTASSLAMAHYRHKHLRQPILVDDCEDARALARESLTGGECRLFYCGRVVDPLSYTDRTRRMPKSGRPRLRSSPVYCYDCNSLYPSVMRDNLFPRELVAYKAAGELDDLTSWRTQLCLIAHVKIESPERPFPVLVDGQRWYACGKFWTTLAGPELFQALDAGQIRGVGAIAAYLPGRLFTSFVDELYPQKVAAKKAGRRGQEGFVKMLLNGLPGKFGQRGPEWEWSDMPGPGLMWGSFARCVDGIPDSKRYRCISGHVQQEGDKLDAFQSMPAIEAYVNSYGRAYMYSIRRKIGEGNIFYQDTDSLHLNEEGHALIRSLGLVSDDELGKFRLEGTAMSADYRGPKDYTLDGIHTIAGRKLESLAVSDTVYRQDETEQLDSIVGREPCGVVIVEETSKRFGRYHPHGRMLRDGRVLPAFIQGGILTLLPPGREHEPKEPSHKRKPVGRES